MMPSKANILILSLSVLNDIKICIAMGVKINQIVSICYKHDRTLTSRTSDYDYSLVKRIEGLHNSSLYPIP